MIQVTFLTSIHGGKDSTSGCLDSTLPKAFYPTNDKIIRREGEHENHREGGYFIRG